MKITDQKNVQSYGISQTDGQEANGSGDLAKPSSTGLGELRDRFETSGKKALDELMGPNQLLGPNNGPITGARQFEIQNQAELKPNPVETDLNLRKKVDQPDPPQALPFQDGISLLSLSPEQFLIDGDGVVILRK